MDALIQEVLITIVIFGAFFGIGYVFLVTRHRERMTMLERGVDASVFAPPRQSFSLTLKFGMLFVGIALGVLAGYGLHQSYGLAEEVAFVSMVFLLGGLALIANFLIERKLNQSPKD
jgi:L-cystine uptake protein TcyP (sodium:dicarboxylate symporter family)